MDDRQRIHPERFTSLCGGYTQAVDFVMAFERTLWKLAFTPGQKSTARRFRLVDRRELLGELHKTTGSHLRTRVIDQAADLVIQKLAAARPALCHDREDGQLLFSVSALQPVELARSVLENVRPEHELRYFVMRNIRTSYNCVLSAPTAHTFRLLANATNDLRAATYRKRDVTNIGPSLIENPHPSWAYSTELYPTLFAALTRDDVYRSTRKSLLPCYGEPDEIIQFFIECCRAVGYFRAHDSTESIRMRTATIDSEYLLSHLFGVSSSIIGLNELFGGGGLLLTEAAAGDGDAGEAYMHGRTSLIIGRFGTGKSLMALQLAVDVARKGGVAWVTALEQSAEEHLYTLESVNALPKDGTVVVVTDAHSLNRALAEKTDKGLLIILNSMRDSYDDFLTELLENANKLRPYVLRLLVVDPVNSIMKTERKDATELRAQTLDVINQVERMGTNVLLVAEDEVGSRREFSFEEKIADTVIRLSIDTRHHYAQRYFEITKSRLQREQRGEHPFSIVPGVGINIFPSAASVRARIRARGFRPMRTAVEFGHSDLDYFMGKEAIFGGDVVVFHGPGGALKRELGLLFLLKADMRDTVDTNTQLRPLSLLVSARDDEFTYQHMLEQNFLSRKSKWPKSLNDRGIRICSLPSGYVNPGYILQRLERELSLARAEGFWIDRVMVDSVSHWEISCPLVRDDETFGDTLLDYFRRHGLTSLLICGEPSASARSVVQKSIINGADSIVEFNRLEIRGRHHITLRIVKTRGMTHRRDLFNINLINKTSELAITPSLIRIAPNGDIKPVKVSLFLHSETSAQKQVYNEGIVKKIKVMLSPDTEIGTQDRSYISSKANLSYSSIVDELQIYQLDEFQLPDASESGGRDFPLHVFPISRWPKEWDQLLERFVKRVRNRDKSFFGVPFYSNISLLSYNSKKLAALREGKATGAEEVVGSWSGMVEACRDWEEKNPGKNDIFFDYPRVTAENYNCLFWEILLTLERIPERLGYCRLRAWLQGETAVEAAKIFRTLCRRAYLADPNKEVKRHQYEDLKEPIDVSPTAVVWRHWYSSLNQMMSKLEPEGREEITVTHLPGQISVAGEWYCAIPVHSAAPEVGLEIIKLLTDSNDSFRRQQIGIGLPVTDSFYKTDSRHNSIDFPISPYFSVDAEVLSHLTKFPFRRSDFGCYLQAHEMLSHTLRRIIEIPEGNETDIDDQIREYFISLQLSFDSIGADWTCNKCCRTAPAKGVRSKGQGDSHKNGS